MDEQLKQKIMIPVIAGGLTFMVVKMAISLWEFTATSMLAGIVAGAVAAGIAFGVVHMMQRD